MRNEGVRFKNITICTMKWLKQEKNYMRNEWMKNKKQCGH